MGHSATAIAPFWGQAWSRVCVRRTPSEVWIGASAPPAIDRAARLAEGWIASPSLTREEAHKQADLYRERCAAYGRQPGAIALRRDIYVGESSSEAQAVLQHALSRGYRSMPAEALIAGSVDEVAEQFRTLGDIGYTDILVRHLTNDQPKVLGSLERLAGVPMPYDGRRSPCLVLGRRLAP